MATLTCVASMLLAGSAEGAVTIGSPTVDVTPEGGTGCGVFPCVFTDTALPGSMLTSPVNGTITGWASHPTSSGTALQLRVLRPTAGGQYAFVASGPVESGLSADPQAFGASLAVKQGDRIGVQMTAGSLGSLGSLNPIPGALGEVFNGAPADGGSAAPDAMFPDWEFLLNARIEPDNRASVVSSRRLKKKGRARVQVSVPNPGNLTIESSTALIKPVVLSLGAPSTPTFTLLPTKRTWKRLKKKGKARGAIEIVFTPSFGAAATQSLPLSLKLKRKKKHRR